MLQVLSSIRTVVAFGGEEKEVTAYSQELSTAKRNSIVKGTITMGTVGLMFGLVYGAYGLGLWYGVKLIMDYRDQQDWFYCVGNCTMIEAESQRFDCLMNCDRFTVGSVVTAVFGILNGGLQVVCC